MEWLFDPQALAALVTLTLLEIVLGIDNIIFIAILADKLPEHQRARARTVGLSMAVLTRIALLHIYVIILPKVILLTLMTYMNSEKTSMPLLLKSKM